MVTTLSCIIFQGYIYSQTTNWTEKYSYTVLYDDFSNSQINLDNWDIENNAYFSRTVFINSTATVSVNSGNLRLSAISCPNCTSGGTTSNYAGGKVISKDKFQYGIFESRIHFARKMGTEAFFLLRGGNDVPCTQGGLHEIEIDVAEYWYDWLTAAYYNYSNKIKDYHTGTDCVENNELKDDYSSGDTTNSFITFKCIWTPSYVRCYINNFLSLEVLNTGQEWFPVYSSHLSIFQALGTDIPTYIDVPQTTYIDYVSVKKFFATPQITCPATICSTGTATMDVDSQASNITWQLSPSSLFSTSSGTGSTANIVAANTVSGVGKIIYTFQMPSGESFTAEKSFWVGTPPVPQINSNTSYVWSTSYFPSPSKVFTIYTGEEIDFFDENTNTLGGLVQNSGTWTWDIDAGGASHEDFDYGPGSRMCFFYEPCSVRVKAKLSNLCGETDWSYPVYIEVLQQLTMSLSPNPGADETTIELNSGGNNRSSNIHDWELEIYDTMQSLKTKVSKIKGKSTTVNTSNWKDGVYLVRAKIGKKQISEKLVVKH